MKVLEPPQDINRISTSVCTKAKRVHICKRVSHMQIRQPFGLPAVSVIKNRLLRAVQSLETVCFAQKCVSSFFFRFFIGFSHGKFCAPIQSENVMRSRRTCSPSASTCFACVRGGSSCDERNTCEFTCKWVILRTCKTCYRPQTLRCHFKYWGRYKWTLLILLSCDILVENFLIWMETINFSYRVRILRLPKCLTVVTSGFYCRNLFAVVMLRRSAN